MTPGVMPDTPSLQPTELLRPDLERIAERAELRSSVAAIADPYVGLALRALAEKNERREDQLDALTRRLTS